MAENAIEVQEKPILFSGPMVKAILEGRKTQSRRVVKPQPTVFPEQGKGLWHHVKGAKWESGLPYRCPYGKPGDRLWVRETWRPWGFREDAGAAFLAGIQQRVMAIAIFGITSTSSAKAANIHGKRTLGCGRLSSEFWRRGSGEHDGKAS